MCTFSMTAITTIFCKLKQVWTHIRIYSMLGCLKVFSVIFYRVIYKNVSHSDSQLVPNSKNEKCHLFNILFYIRILARYTFFDLTSFHGSVTCIFFFVLSKVFLSSNMRMQILLRFTLLYRCVGYEVAIRHINF